MPGKRRLASGLTLGKPATDKPYLCPHGVRRGRDNWCEDCEEVEAQQFRDNAPAELRIVEQSTGRTIAVHRIPKGLGPKKKGRRMAERPKLSLFKPVPAADARPRLHLRLAERDGEVAIGYRSHPTAIERFAPSIELAMGELLGDGISQPAILIWDGITAAAVRVRDEEE